MPSGPEGDQEISEHTLMHPKKKKKNDWILFLSPFFPPNFIIFRLTQALIQVSYSLPPFVLLLFIAHVMNWFPLPHLIQGVLGLRMGLEFLTYKNDRSFCQNLNVYFMNKCL